MKQIGLALITVAIVAFAWKVSEDKAPQTEVARTALLPSLLDTVNDAERIKLSSAKHQTTLTRAGEQWLLSDKDDFPATASEVKRALLQLATLRVIEAKTDDPARYAKLGVEPLDSDEAAGSLIEVTAAGGSKLVDLIVGNVPEASSGDRRYVRRANETQSWLVEGALDIPTDPIRWLDASIADIDTERVREVRITAGDAVPITITKAERNDNFYTLQNIPEGHEAKSKATVSSIAAIMLDLRFNDVASVQRVADLSPSRHVEVETFDGLLVALDDYEIDDKTYTRFSFRYSEALVVPDSEGSESEQTDEKPDADNGEPPESESVADEASRLGAKSSDWIYVLPNYKRRMINRKFDSLIKASEPEE